MDATFETRKVTDIKETFMIPSYQRGYRWGEQEVRDLLDDISEFAEPGRENDVCYLQPIIVKKKKKDKDGNDIYDLIDGQQRLTTLYIIGKYINDEKPEFPGFGIAYDTRPKSADFIKQITDKKYRTGNSDECIDHWHMSKAYEAVESWFGNDKLKKSKISEALDRVSVFWYELPEKEDAATVFTRINAGKIPLTNAELVKALFLSRGHDGSGNGLTEKQKNDIAVSWNDTEQDLRNDKFWYFLTKSDRSDKYQTRIDLLLELITGESAHDEYDRYAPFRKLHNNIKAHNFSAEPEWQKLDEISQILKDWFESPELYNKIGYLIEVGTDSTLKDIHDEYQKNTISDFDKKLIEMIQGSVRKLENEDGEIPYEKLKFDDKDQKELLGKLLLLFNVIEEKNKGEKFSFEDYKREQWSIEHINPQTPQEIIKNAERLAWLEVNARFLIDCDYDRKKDTSKLEDALPDKPDDKVKTEDKVRVIAAAIAEYLECEADLKALQDKMREKFRDEAEERLIEDRLHSIYNLTLLPKSENAALGNSIFAVKRSRIRSMEKENKYIPYCTIKVFKKEYTDTYAPDYKLWDDTDMNAYAKAITASLKNYGVVVEYKEEDANESK